MTSIYEAKTVHTEQMLKDFITFREAAKNRHINFQLLMIGGCAATLAVIGKGGAVTYIFGVVAILFVGFALVRKRIAFSKLAKADVNYQTQSEIEFVFGESGFRVNNPDAEKEQRIRYAEVTLMYVDDNYFYINVNNEDLHMIPKGDFTMGTPGEFREFMERKTEKLFQPVKLSWKTKFFILKQALEDNRNDADVKK